RVPANEEHFQLGARARTRRSRRALGNNRQTTEDDFGRPDLRPVRHAGDFPQSAPGVPAGVVGRETSSTAAATTTTKAITLAEPENAPPPLCPAHRVNARALLSDAALLRAGPLRRIADSCHAAVAPRRSGHNINPAKPAA